MRGLLRGLTAAGLLLAAASAAAADFKIVVNERNPNASLSRTEVSDLLLKKQTHWSDGSSVVPVDQPRTSAARAAICLQIHRRSPEAVKNYWRQQIFSGRDLPPIEKASDDQVVAFVRANPGAIGYVSESAVTAGVRVVVVE